MKLNIEIDSKQITPDWKLSISIPLSEEIHLIKLKTSKNMDWILGKKGMLYQKESEKLARISKTLILPKNK